MPTNPTHTDDALDKALVKAFRALSEAIHKEHPLPDFYPEFVRLSEAVAALSQPQHGGLVGAQSYADFQQRRGRLPDLIEGAIEIYDGFMLDDDYDAYGCLDKIIAKLKSGRDFYDNSAALSSDSPVAGEDDRFWLIVREPGCVPNRKGPFKIADTAKVLREFMAANPTAFIDYLTVRDDGTPDVEHGPQVLQYTDGRSMSVGSKHNERVRAALAAKPAPTDTADNLCSDCPPVGYPTDKTRCVPCLRRTTTADRREAIAPTFEDIRQAVVPVIGACLLMHSNDPRLADPRVGVGAEVANAVLALIPTPLPDGYVAVPIEPTEAMIGAASRGASMDLRTYAVWHKGLLANWKAMIAARPRGDA